ncbi:hypothetical protein [Salipiger pentaromativorans]|uniref:hypothetical protein n=1 Tax=Salipiger pentaromativorans TaxID=2943193 RepID=UPI002158880F|nr:hypothetical protein [Salipiger pentaromativorans]
MTDKRKAEEGGLAPWFEAGRAEVPAPSGDWLARMEAMALAEQPAPRPQQAPDAGAAPRGGWLREMLGVLGGWPAMAGLVAACATGIWFGAAAPSGVSDWLSASAGDGISALEPASGFDYAMLGL